MVSCRITTPSKIFLSFMKADWEGWINFWATRAIRLVNALVKFLKLTLSKQIGRYYWICATSFSFGSNIIVPKLRLYRGRLPLWKSSKRGRRSPFINSQKLDRTRLGTHQVQVLYYAPFEKKCLFNFFSKRSTIETSFLSCETCEMSCVVDSTKKKWLPIGSPNKPL